MPGWFPAHQVILRTIYLNANFPFIHSRKCIKKATTYHKHLLAACNAEHMQNSKSMWYPGALTDKQRAFNTRGGAPAVWKKLPRYPMSMAVSYSKLSLLPCETSSRGAHHAFDTRIFPSRLSLTCTGKYLGGMPSRTHVGIALMRGL